MAITVFAIFVVLALIALAIHLMASARCPLWVSVLFIIVALLVQIIPKG